MTLLGELYDTKHRFVLANIDRIYIIHRYIKYGYVKHYFINNINVTSQIRTLKRRKLIKTYPIIHLTAEY